MHHIHVVCYALWFIELKEFFFCLDRFGDLAAHLKDKVIFRDLFTFGDTNRPLHQWSAGV